MPSRLTSALALAALALLAPACGDDDTTEMDANVVEDASEEAMTPDTGEEDASEDADPPDAPEADAADVSVDTETDAGGEIGMVPPSATTLCDTTSGVPPSEVTFPIVDHHFIDDHASPVVYRDGFVYAGDMGWTDLDGPASQGAYVVRMNARTGGLDTQYGDRGVFWSDDVLRPRSLIPLGNGQLLIGAGNNRGNDSTYYGVLRLLDTGLLDTSFATGNDRRSNDNSSSPGHLRTWIPGIQFLTLGASNHMYLHGAWLTGPGMARADLEGTIDPSYNPDGPSPGAFEYPPVTDEEDPRDFATEDMYEAVVASGDAFYLLFSNRNRGSVFIRKILQTGVVDTTYGTDGAFRYDHEGDRMVPTGLVVLEDGSARISAYLGDQYDPDGWVALSVNATGALDPTFGDGGVFTSDIGGNGRAHSLYVAEDESIILTGDVGERGERDMAMLRLAPDGTIATTFCEDGLVVFDHTAQVSGRGGVATPDGFVVIGSLVTNSDRPAGDIPPFNEKSGAGFVFARVPWAE